MSETTLLHPSLLISVRPQQPHAPLHPLLQLTLLQENVRPPPHLVLPRRYPLGRRRPCRAQDLRRRRGRRAQALACPPPPGGLSTHRTHTSVPQGYALGWHRRRGMRVARRGGAQRFRGMVSTPHAPTLNRDLGRWGSDVPRLSAIVTAEILASARTFYASVLSLRVLCVFSGHFD